MKYARLFFDGRCGLCRKEIALLRRLSRGLKLVDVHQLPATQLGPSKAQMLAILHLQLEDGQFITGVEASVMAWSYTPLGWLFKPLLWPGVRPWAEKAYQRWALSRLKRLDYCQLPMAEKPAKLKRSS